MYLMLTHFWTEACRMVQADGSSSDILRFNRLDLYRFNMVDLKVLRSAKWIGSTKIL